MLKASNLCFSYKKQGPFLFEDLSFELERGSTLAILGPNGAGKTTLLRCLMNFLSLRKGNVSLFDKPVSGMNEKEFWKYISYVPQAKKLVFGYSAIDMVVMGLSQNIGIGMTPKRSDYEKAHELLRQFGISAIAEQSCNTLSGGQLQMVLIARALIKEPELLIMDEPESGLDMKNQMIVLETIEALSRKNLSIIINTHYPDHALRCADKTLLLGRSGFLFGDTGDVITESNIRDYFGVEAHITHTSFNGRSYQGIVPMELVDGHESDKIRNFIKHTA
ncbi:ABC-type cobalamin/Fe3+-siderophore transport system, ATPase component [Lachnospiraceae bacterium JC7]|nr:ABC-type cobalamin/Fe3+-siderophore transport system, ATPase component [Lachnospiraceae bacterium JC7]